MDRPAVVLVGSEHEENLSLRYLAAAVERAGFPAVIVAWDGGAPEDRAVEQAIAARPIVVGISVPFQHRAQEMLSLAQRLRAAGYRGHITTGGHFATFEHTAILRAHPSIDSVVRHEGEETLVELTRAVYEGGPLRAIPGLVIRGPSEKRLPLIGMGQGDAGVIVGPERPLPKLDHLPFPDRRGDAMEILGVRSAPIIGSRGCYADCSFCCIHAYAEAAKGPRYRMRSVANIVEEMKLEYDRRKVRLFVFHDDNFFLPFAPKNIQRYEEMGARLRELGMTDIGIVIKCRPNDVDPHLFRVLMDMGVIRAYVGIETSSDEGIVSLNRRITNDDNRRALRTFSELGLYSSFNMLIFDPEATLLGIEKNLDFMEEHTAIPWNFCRAEVYAGTPLKAKLEADGRLSGDYLAWTYEMREPRVELLFRMATTAFFGRNFKSDGLANLNMGIRFDAEVLKHFYRGAWDEALGQRLTTLSRAVGESSVRLMREALSFVRSVNLSARREVQTFTLDLTRRVTRADLELLAEVKSIRRELAKRAGLAGQAHSHAALPWAFETARLSSSTGREASTEILPAPAALAL